MSVPTAWFHVDPLPAVGATTVLDDREATHAVRVRRLGDGAAMTLFDGRGRIAAATIETVRSAGTPRAGRAVEVTITSVAALPAPAPFIHLACALPKSDRQSTLLGMATQLGMNAFTPLKTGRAVVDAGRNFHERGRRICIEACKQSRRAWLPDLRSPRTLDHVLAHPDPAGATIWIADPEGTAAADVPIAGDGLLVLIGPEGGFEPGEVDAADAAGAVRVALGDGILRIETAAIATLAVVRARSRR
ncbi:MAG: 16S rRNA (uracil(1498)-N(3))-methyltransferase [Phycisphaerales bacterium]|nr:16S rRNA (uracil(1498)-N(3))-methyltransferase [Phycisphaerales bacterium]